MIDQGNSKTQQLIYRSSYRKHKERLADIRQNITSNDYNTHLPKYRQEIKRRQSMDKTKKEDYQFKNHILKNKINAGKGKTANELELLFSTQKVRKLQAKGWENDEQGKVQVKSELNDGQPLRCVLPGHKNRASSYVQHTKEAMKLIPYISTSHKYRPTKSSKKFDSSNALRQSQHQPAFPNQKQKDLFFNLPQRNENRVVIHKKTLFIGSMQSCLIELSTLNERLLIAAYMMGIQNYTLRELLPFKRSIELLKEYQNNYQQLCNHITLEKCNNKYQIIRIRQKDSQTKVEPSEQSKNKLKSKVQNQFIKRNYYTLIKTEDQPKNQKVEDKEKPSVSREKVKALVDRLAVPKRYYKFQILNREGEVHGQIESNLIKKPENGHQKQSIIDLVQEQAKPHKKKTQPNQSKSIVLNGNGQKQKASIAKSSQFSKIKIGQRESRDPQNNQQEVQYLDGEEDYDQYKQSFENASEIIKNGSKHTVKPEQNVKNNSHISNKSKNSKLKEPTNKNQSYENIYEEQFEPEKNEQNYEQSFEVSNLDIVENNKSKTPNQVNSLKVQQEYQQEFQS